MTDKQNAKGRHESIRKFCLACMGGNSYEVGRCKSFYCALHPYRQFSVDKTTLFDFSISDNVILELGYERLVHRGYEDQDNLIKSTAINHWVAAGPDIGGIS